jgi:hypothetical protein
MRAAHVIAHGHVAAGSPGGAWGWWWVIHSKARAQPSPRNAQNFWQCADISPRRLFHEEHEQEAPPCDDDEALP